MSPSQSVDLSTLNWIMTHEFGLPEGNTALDCLPGLMQNLGSTESDVREGSLDVLWTWIATAKYTDPDLLVIANQMTVHMTVGLGEKDTDSVFLRAFSTLILAAVLEVDILRREKGEQPLVNAEQIHGWLATSLKLLREEQDLRGIVQGKGWAHCCAHTGDLLGDFASHPLLDQHDLENILETLQIRITSPTETPFIHNEDERLAAVVMNLLQRELVTEDFFKNWLAGFVKQPDRPDWKEAFTLPTWNAARVNTKSFLRGIYFFLLFGYKDQPEQRHVAMMDQLSPMLLTTLKQIYPFSRYADMI